jgi:CxxC-x17-CxxC domain-containing protein
MTETLSNYKRRGGHPIAFEDKQLQCVECGAEFTFSAEEQQFFQSKGYTNEPKRCLPCREAKRSQRYGSYGSGYRAPRQMYPAVCAECGQETEVPFEPRDGRPVYCSECYTKIRLKRED